LGKEYCHVQGLLKNQPAHNKRRPP
jgi:hypothetical protein